MLSRIGIQRLTRRRQDLPPLFVHQPAPTIGPADPLADRVAPPPHRLVVSGPLSLNVGRQKQPLTVLAYGETHRTAELISAGRCSTDCRGVVFAKRASAIIFVSLAVNFVGARLGHYVKQAAGGAAEFRSKPVRNYLKFLNGFDGNGEVLGFQ